MKAKKNLILLFLISVFLNTSAFAQKKNHDSTYYAKILNESILKVTYTKDSAAWIIAGEKGNKLFYLNNKKTKNISEKIHLPANNEYSDLYCLNNGNLILGTKNNFLYIIHNKKVFWLNKAYGLNDSTIVAIQKLNSKDRIIVKTKKSWFEMSNYKKIRSVRFKEINDSTASDDFSEFYRQNLQLPVQKLICDISSPIDYSFRKIKYVNDSTVSKIKRAIQPGDIIIKRNDNQVTNWGISGFWTHSGIFIGGEKELDIYFDSLKMLNGQKPTEYIKENYPDIYPLIAARAGLIIEAIGEGVVINPVDHIAKVDYMAILRTKLDKEDIFKSLLTSFEYLGTPYDFLFDFSSDETVVCSELVYLSFRPAPDKKGINFKLGELNGKPFLSPNDIAKQYSDEYETTQQQFNLVMYFEGDKKIKSATPKDEKRFCQTYKKLK